MFEIYSPCIAGELDTVMDQIQDVLPTGQGKLVLLVEDEIAVLEAMDPNLKIILMTQGIGRIRLRLPIHFRP